MMHSVRTIICLLGFIALATHAQTPTVQDGASGYSVVCALVDQPHLRSCADLAEAHACLSEPEFASRPSKEPTGMVFANRSSSTVRIYWLDFQGNRRLYRNLSPGDKTSQSTFIGHNWLIADLHDRCIGIFKAAPQSFAFF